MGATGASLAVVGAEAGPRVKAFVNDQESEGVIRQALADVGIEDFAIVTGDVRTATTTLAKQSSPRLLIVDISGVDDQVSSIIDLAEVCEPGISLVAIGDSNDIAIYRQLKHAGVIEYFYKPLIRDQVAQSCNDILTERFDQPNLFTGKLVFVIGVRGGVGATTLATNSAWYMAETRQRWTTLVDLDLENGDTALLLDVEPGLALREAFERPERVDKLFLERGAIHVGKRLDLLSSLESIGSAVEGSEEAVATLIERLLRRYRLVIVDLPAPIAVHLPKVLQMPSACVLVSSATLSSARDMARWREYIGPNTRERRTLQVLNHVSPHGGLTELEFTRAGGHAPDVVIPFDPDMASSVNFGVRAMKKNSEFRAGMTRMLHDVTGEPLESSSSFFKRIFAR